MEVFLHLSICHIHDRNKNIVLFLKPDVADYEPRKFLRCHGNSDDDGIKVWSCAFEPSPHKPGTFRDHI